VRSFKRLLDKFRDKELQVYMMANQLPLLQLGRDKPEVTNMLEAYCQPGGGMVDKRYLKQLSIVAFSDPNDLLSYAIPPKFSENWLDSRFCPNITNVIIGVANVVGVFGLGEIANPLEAHVGYDGDERVIGIIAKGIGNQSVAEVVGEKCSWLETVS